MSLPLDGVRVLELARFQAGPRGGMILSDLGAEVIKMSTTPGRLGPVPTPGQHTDQVLHDVLGYDDAAILALRQQGAVK